MTVMKKNQKIMSGQAMSKHISFSTLCKEDALDIQQSILANERLISMVHFLNRLYEDGWRGRYYQNKFSVNPDDEQEFDNFTGKVVSSWLSVLLVGIHLWISLEFYIDLILL
jgi:5'-3' exonuclease